MFDTKGLLSITVLLNVQSVLLLNDTTDRNIFENFRLEKVIYCSDVIGSKIKDLGFSGSRRYVIHYLVNFLPSYH